MDPLAPPTESTPEPDDHVGFCRDAPEPDWPEAKATPAEGHWDQQLWMGAFCAAGLLIAWIINSIPTPHPLVLTAFALTLIAAAAFVIWKKRRSITGFIEDPPILRRSSARVRCAGDVPLLLAIRSRGPFDPELSFEPVIRGATFSVPQRRSIRWTFESIRFILAIAFIFGARFLGFRVDACFYVALAIAVASLLAGSLILVLSPTYIRITPGKLEIMRFAFARRTPEIETFDLTGATIWAWAGKKAFIETARPNANRLVIHLSPIRHREEFTHALLWAGVSKVRAPDLPRTDLLG